VGGFVFISLCLGRGMRVLRRLRDNGLLDWISINLFRIHCFYFLPLVALADFFVVVRCPVSHHSIIFGSYRTQRRRS
jgi:hypothetical protein